MGTTPTPTPARRPRPIWPVIGVIAAIARTAMEAWRLFNDS